MASLQKDPSGNYHVCFRLGGTRFKRSLHTDAEDQATNQLALLEENLRLVNRGKLVIPDDADVPTFLLSDGKINQPVALPENLTLGQLIYQYEESLPKGAIEESTRYTIKIHASHLKEVLGESLSVRCLTRDDLQRYINTRAKKKGRHGKTLSPITIRKEVTTLSGIWTWAMAAGRVGPFPNKGLKYPKVSEKPPFQTWQEIEKQIKRGGLSEQEEAELWDCLFLSLKEIAELLGFVKTAALQPFIYPMFVFAAHTGARRSELIRSRLADFDDDTVVIRERKRTKGKLTTRRVSLSPLLKKAMKDWLKEHPGGPGRKKSWGC